MTYALTFRAPAVRLDIFAATPERASLALARYLDDYFGSAPPSAEEDVTICECPDTCERIDVLWTDADADTGKPFRYVSRS